MLIQLREVVNIPDDILKVKQEVEAEFFGVDPSWSRVETNLPSQAQTQARYSEPDNRDWRNRSAQLPAPVEERSWETIKDRDFGGRFDPRQQDGNQYNKQDQMNSQFARAQYSSNQGVHKMDVGHCILDGNTDAVEFCPHDSFHNLLAASTYVLQEGDRPSRSGCITLFDVDAEIGRLESIQKVETGGIFDIKWSPQDTGLPLLAQADADGCVKIYSLQSSDSRGSEIRDNPLNEVSGKCISSSMCLCIDWNPSATSMAVGLSDGSVSIVSLHESEINVLQEWKAHDFELWAASFDIQQPMLVYTGSDDCKFSCWDLRDTPANPIFQNKKTHKMGVCCIAKSPFDSNTLLTGSYDECLRIWDVRSISTPVSESSIGLGGGVWRIKHHPYIPGLVLTACMHNGFAIVRFDGDQARVVETYNKHGSLAYGADWQRGKSRAIATCSFYDRLVRVWTPEGDVFS